MTTITRALLFDFDGLIVDTESIWAEVFIEVMAEDGITVGLDDVRPFVGVAAAEYERLFATFAVKHLPADWDRDRFRSRAIPRLDARNTSLVVLPGVVQLVGAARAAGWRTGIGTGSQREVITGRLDGLGLSQAFDAVVTIEDVERGKPSPDIYLELAARLGVEPSACVVLEDSAHGCEAAIAARMHVVACPCGVTIGSVFPDGAHVVETLDGLDLHVLAAL